MMPNRNGTLSLFACKRLGSVCALVVSMGYLASPSARAQDFSAPPRTIDVPMSNFISNSFLNQELMINATRENPTQTDTAKPLPLAPPQTERNAAELAKAAPAAQRAKLEKIYVQLMPGYRELERRLGWPQDDAAGAIAALIAGNYMAMTGTEPSDESVTAAGNQLRASASVQAMLEKLTPGDRRRLYEQCAMLGIFMAVANKTSEQQSKEVLANLRHSARENLRVVLGARVDQLRFTPRGIEFQ